MRASGKDSLLTQLRIGRLLDPIELRPPQLPSSAILYIRKLRDPLPGSLQLEQAGVRPPPAWQEALSATLDRLASRALRPAREAVPPSAEAVMFIDRSELLACLATDWCEGRIMSRWWWQSLLKRGATAQVVKELWRRDPQYVPAALQQLAGNSKATDFVRVLSDSEALQLLRGVVESFSLPALARVLGNFETPASSDRDSLGSDQPATATRQGGVQIRPGPAPWRPWVPECRAVTLRPEQEFFLGVSLMLQRAPVKARAPEFHANVREWQRDIASARAGEAAQPICVDDRAATLEQQPQDAVDLDARLLADSPAQDLEVSRAAVRARAEGRFGAPSESDTARYVRDSQDATDPALSDTSSSQTLGVTQIQGDRPTHDPQSARSMLTAPIPATDAPPPVAQNDLPIVEDEVGQPTTGGLSSSPDSSSAKLWDDDAEFEPIEARIATKFGGSFYLINLGLFMGFYGDFTTPDEPGIQLSIWDFVALLTCELVGDEVKADPVWPLLQQLAQREEGELLGSGFDPDTVKSFEFQVSSSELDEEVSGEPETRNSKLKTRNAELETRNSKLETSSAVAAWIDRLMPHVRARLRQALGLSEQDDPGPLVCRQRARVCVTPTHLDVFFFLADLPIEIRYAGLDRNPGWVPAAGKFIAFHFE